MVKNSAASLLTSVDDLFTTQEERDEAKRETIMDIPISQISDFPNHPFKVKMDESMSDLVESIISCHCATKGKRRIRNDSWAPTQESK